MSYGMSMGQGMYQEQRAVLKLEQVLLLGDKVGEIPLFSLHRIKNRIGRNPGAMQVHAKVKSNLIYNLVQANREYRKETGKEWNCITGNSLDSAVDKTNAYMIEVADTGLVTVDEPTRATLQRVLHQQVEQQNGIIRAWFHENYNVLLYNMDKKIPWPIIKAMRDELGKWSVHNVNPFDSPIQDLIEETISSLGLNPGNYKDHQEMWKELGKYARPPQL